MSLNWRRQKKYFSIFIHMTLTYHHTACHCMFAHVHMSVNKNNNFFWNKRVSHKLRLLSHPSLTSDERQTEKEADYVIKKSTIKHKRSRTFINKKLIFIHEKKCPEELLCLRVLSDIFYGNVFLIFDIWGIYIIWLVNLWFSFSFYDFLAIFCVIKIFSTRRILKSYRFWPLSLFFTPKSIYGFLFFAKPVLTTCFLSRILPHFSHFCNFITTD